MLLTVLSVCCTVLVLNLHHRKSPVPEWLQRLLAAHRRLCHKGHNAVQDTAGDVKSMNHGGADKQTSPEKVDEIRKAKSDKDEDGAHGTWVELAEVVNAVLWGIYIFSSVVMGCVFITLWMQG